MTDYSGRTPVEVPAEKLQDRDVALLVPHHYATLKDGRMYCSCGCKTWEPDRRRRYNVVAGPSYDARTDYRELIRQRGFLTRRCDDLTRQRDALAERNRELEQWI